ncbi:MAG TPA: PEP-CTERM sorting domain-containing protein, partial [Tepidisphaeraceae bacterium]|nr:PEP-CTERM sorting domain-containing protein [Tepidisphaeraceae bacterium]
VNPAGAEIDLFGDTDAGFWTPGNGSTKGETYFDAIFDDVTLTSGTTNYPDGGPISGADIAINSNPQAVYSLDFFRRLLSHEIGHAIGMADVEGSINPGAFIDDNYDSNDPLATLTNSWAAMVDPLDPGASIGLQRYNVSNAAIGTSGVNILMESFGLGIAAGNPVGNLTPLSNDDYGIRQFMYPVVPEPTSIMLIGVGAIAMMRRTRR